MKQKLIKEDDELNIVEASHIWVVVEYGGDIICAYTTEMEASVIAEYFANTNDECYMVKRINLIK